MTSHRCCIDVLQPTMSTTQRRQQQDVNTLHHQTSQSTAAYHHSGQLPDQSANQNANQNLSLQSKSNRSASTQSKALHQKRGKTNPPAFKSQEQDQAQSHSQPTTEAKNPPHSTHRHKYKTVNLISKLTSLPQSIHPSIIHSFIHLPTPPSPRITTQSTKHKAKFQAPGQRCQPNQTDRDMKFQHVRSATPH
jgi:hypothetical protein